MFSLMSGTEVSRKIWILRNTSISIEGSKILQNKIVELQKFQDFTKCQEVPKDQVMTYHSEYIISNGKCV